jgi:Aldo/keto reductase family
MTTTSTDALDRRGFLIAAGGLAATPLLDDAERVLAPPTVPPRPPAVAAMTRRKLRSLEVSSLGLGVQNMSRTYQTTIPYRPEMLRIIHAAYDRGVTFFDAAEAYGPHEVERILGEASHRSATRSPSRRSSAGTSTLRPASAGPDSTAGRRTSSSRSRACSGGCAPTESTCSISIGSIRPCRSRTSPVQCWTS